MKKIMILMIAIVIALSAMPVSAAESTPLEIANPDIEVLTSFASCTVPRCGGTVVLSCSGRMMSDTTLGLTCTISAHNEYESCNNYAVIYYNDGYCNRCYAPISKLITEGLNAYYIKHTHSYKHIFSTGNGTYSTEYWPSCNI